MKFYEELKWRGLIKDEAGEDLEEKLNNGGLTCYVGADPSADSLHIGQLPTFLMIERLRRAGHKVIVLVGGATGRVGDPRGTKEREKKEESEVENNFVKIKAQIKKLFGEDTQVVNNYDWFKNYNYIDFLRDVGKYVNVSYMINKDLVKRQMESGISYAEFSYMLIQGYDFKYLHDNFGAVLQFGGSDQWGNLTTGIELIKKLNDEEVYAFSMPLTLDSNGNKIGKSEGNALWLDINKTSSYDMYQFIINFEDSMMDNYLKRYTFLSKEEIEEVLRIHNEAPEKRYAQNILAKEIITFLHGKEEYEKALKISEALFTGNYSELNEKEIMVAFKDVPSIEVKEDCTISDLLVNNNVVSSKRELREFLSSNAITLNGNVINDENYVVSKKNAINGSYAILKRGKKRIYLLKF